MNQLIPRRVRNPGGKLQRPVTGVVVGFMNVESSAPAPTIRADTRQALRAGQIFVPDFLRAGEICPGIGGWTAFSRVMRYDSPYPFSGNNFNSAE